jgi:hypothetical protein
MRYIVTKSVSQEYDIEIFSRVYELNRCLSHDNKKETISKIRVLLEQADHSTLKEIDSRLRLHETHHRYIKQRLS